MRTFSWIKVVGIAVLVWGAFVWNPVAQQASVFEIPQKFIPLAQHNPKLSDALLFPSQPGAVPQTAGSNTAGSVRAVIEAGRMGLPSDGALRALGAVVEARSRSLLRVRVPPQRLQALSALPGVAYVRKPYKFQAPRFPVSQAVTPIGATLMHNFDVQGQGVKIAIIDIGFGSMEYAISSGALAQEAVAQFTDYSGAGERQGNHGTAVALIVHEVAPKAQLYLMQVGDEVDLENAVDEAIRQGVRIINHSVGWTNSNFSDGTGIFAEFAQRAQDAGILWVNAAGNHSASHWTGRLLDENRNGWSDFPGGFDEALRIQAFFGLIEVNLTWDDWPTTSQDLDLYLYNSKGQLVASSSEWQTGSEAPVETLEYLVLEPDVFFVKVLIRRAVKPLRIKLFTDGAHPLQPSIPHGSLLAPADAAAVLSVGAIAVDRWDSGPQESFSSLGPTSDERIKPDLTGPDNVRNLLINPFAGTSAAAPHVTGAAALLLAQHPAWDVFQLRSALERLTRDLGPPGKDNAYGNGVLDLSLLYTQTTRTISAVQVQPGGQIAVSVSARIAALAFGSFELRESVPAGWTVQSDDPAFDATTNSWYWPSVQQGDVLEVQYTLEVPQGQAPGTYTLSGTINGTRIEEQDTIEVVRSAVPPQATPKIEPSEDNLPMPAVRRLGRELVFSAPSGLSGLTLTVYDLAGDIVYKNHTSGRMVRWNGLTVAGQTAANGVYLVSVRFADRSAKVIPVVWLR